MTTLQKNINELLFGIINQSKLIHLEYNCGQSENLVYMVKELKNKYEQFISEERKKLEAALTLLDNLYQ